MPCPPSSTPLRGPVDLGPPDGSNVPPPISSPPLLPPNPFRTPGKQVQPPTLHSLGAEARRRRRRHYRVVFRVFLVVLAVLLALFLLFLHRVGTGGLYVTQGRVNLGQLKSIATGPIEVFLVPALPENLRDRMNDQINGYFSAIDAAASPSLVNTAQIPGTPTPLGAELLAKLPVPLYGVSSLSRDQFIVQPLPVAPRFLQPGFPADILFMEPFGYLRYRNAMAFLTFAAYSEKIPALRIAVTTDRALLSQQLKSLPLGTTEYYLAQLDYTWLGQFLDYLKQLPATPQEVFTASAQGSGSVLASGPVAISFEPANYDIQLARLAIGTGPLSDTGGFRVQGAGVPVLRVPVGRGQALYFFSPTPIRGIGVTQLSSQLHFDLGYMLQHTFPASPELPPPAPSGS